MNESVLDLAQRFIDQGDASMAVFVLRDTPLASMHGMTDLLWAMHRGGASRREVQGIIEELRAVEAEEVRP